MSDIGAPGSEPSGMGNVYNSGLNQQARGRGRGRGYNTGAQAGFNFDLPGVDAASKNVGSLSSALSGLKNILRDLGSNSYMMMSGIKRITDDIAGSAAKAETSLKNLQAAMKGMGKGAVGGTAAQPFAPTQTYGATPSTASLGGGGSAAGWASNANSSAGAAIAQAGGDSGAGSIGGSAMGAMMGGGNMLDMFGDMAMFPLRFMRERIQTNRQSALFMSQSLTPMTFATQGSQQNQMGNLVNFPVKGTPADVMNVLTTMRQAGAFYGFGEKSTPGAQREGTRAGGFMRGLQEMQYFTPGVAPTAMAATLGGFGSNVQSQQLGAFQTSGAFSIIKQGGGQKSISEWAESILRWLEGQRPGSDRGTPFDYGQLMAQYFPGSNIDAWFSANGVPPDMREYFWTYALGKAKKTGNTGGAQLKLESPKDNLAYNRLNSQNQFTRNEFGLASRMTGQYTNRETVNTWFNGLMGNIVNKVIPGLTESGPLSIVQWLPDVIEEMMFGMLEKTGPLGQMLIGGGLMGASAFSGLAGGIGGLVSKGIGALNPFGDVDGWGVGDIGDYGPLGGTGTAGLHPDMRKKVNEMMRANPRLSMTSGLRDRSTQQRLRKKGVGRVSGGPSAHTRGMAADLGPPSEFGWLAANAGAFGLASGAGKGEPWHVGMTGDLGVGDLLGSIGGAIGGVASGIGGAAGSLISGAGGLLGGVLDMGGGLLSGLAKAGMGALMGPLAAMTGPAGFLLKLILGGSDNPVGFLNENIGSILNLLLGGFGSLAAGKELGKATSFDPSVMGRLTQNISLGGSMPGFGGILGLLGGLPGLAPSGGTASAGGGGTGITSGGAGGAGTIDPHLIYDYLKQNGVSPASAAGILANIQFESGFNSANASGDNGTSGGLFQHHAGRWAALKNYATSTGRDWTDWKAQVEYALQEAGSYHINLQQTDPMAAAREWTLNFERPSNAAARASERAAVAQNYMFGDLESLYPMGGGGTTTAMQFNNTFHINAGSGSGPNQGIDVRKTASLLADQLETQMRRRLSRVN